MQRTAKWLCVIACILFVICALLTCVDIACFDREFYDNEYRKLDTARTIGMTHSTLIGVTEHLLDYIQDKEETLSVTAEISGKEVNVFDERDTAHMVDVKNLYLTARTVRNILVPVIIVLLVAACFLVKRERLRLLASGCIAGVIIAGVVVGGLAIWAAADFDSFWVTFHQVLFTNDLWQLDPATSVLINMVPSQFFYDLVMRIVSYAAVAIGVPLVLSVVYMMISRIRRRELMTLTED